jgi:hypothetical protein
VSGSLGRNKNKNPNSREHGAYHAIVGPASARRRGNIESVEPIDTIGPVALARIDRAIPPTVAETAVCNATNAITFDELDGGSGDSDGCDGEECCDELPGEHHGCYRAKSGKGGDRRVGSVWGGLRNRSVQSLILLYPSGLFTDGWDEKFSGVDQDTSDGIGKPTPADPWGPSRAWGTTRLEECSCISASRTLATLDPMVCRYPNGLIRPKGRAGRRSSVNVPRSCRWKSVGRRSFTRRGRDLCLGESVTKPSV